MITEAVEAAVTLVASFGTAHRTVEQPWYSVREVDAPVGSSMGYITCFLRDGDRVFLTYSTTGRGNEPVNGSSACST